MNKQTEKRLIESRIVDDTICRYINHYSIPIQHANYDELTQIIWLSLLEKEAREEGFIERMLNDETLTYWVWQATKKQISSTKSRYYYDFVKYNYRNDNPLPKDKEPSDDEGTKYREI